MRREAVIEIAYPDHYESKFAYIASEKICVSVENQLKTRTYIHQNKRSLSSRRHGFKKKNKNSKNGTDSAQYKHYIELMLCNYFKKHIYLSQ